MSQKYFFQEEPRGPSILVEIPVSTNGQQRIALKDVNQLRSTPDNYVVWKGVRLVTDDVLVGGINQVGTNAPLAELQKMALVLYSEGWEKGQYIPLLTLNDVAVPAGNTPYRYQKTEFDDWQRVDLDKSYIQLANGQSTANAPYVVLLEVFYQRFNAEGKRIQ